MSSGRHGRVVALTGSVDPRVRSWSGRLFALLCGVGTTLLVVEVGLRLGGFCFLFQQAYSSEGKFATDPDVVVLALGESTTALGGRQSYPAQLEDVLSERDPETRYVVLNRGIPGANSNQILDWRLQEIQRLKPDVVVAMMGLNDTAWPPNIEDMTWWDKALRSYRTYEAAELILVEFERKREAEPGAKARAIPTPWRDMGFDDGDLLCEGLDLMRRGRYAPVVVLCMDALRVNPRSTEAYVVMAHGLQEIGRPADALTVVRKGMFHSADPILPLQHARFVETRGDAATAEFLYSKVLLQFPDHPLATYRLASMLVTQGRREEAGFLLSQATDASAWALDESDPAGQCVATWMRQLGLHPDIARLEMEGLQVHIQQRAGDSAAAEQALVSGVEEGRQQRIRGQREKCLEYSALIDFYAREGRFQDIDALWTTAADEPAISPCFREVFGQFYLATGQPERARTVFAPDRYYGPRTAGHYRTLLEATRASGSELVCVQYPTRSAEPLKALLPGEEDVFYVDNGAVFQEALERYEYEDLFWDRCYVDFGHGTALGNRLLAESVADVILGEVLAR